MSLTFRGGEELVQRGRGIGAFFRSLSSLVRPIFKSVGSKIVRVATSEPAKAAAKQLGTQALESGLNLTKDMIR